VDARGSAPGDTPGDIGALCLVVGEAVAAAIEGRLAGEGFDGARRAPLAVLDGIAAGDRTVTALALRLGVSTQAASKTVAELVRAGWVLRHADPDDRRARVLVPSARGAELAAAARRARQAVARDLTRWLGTRDAGELARLLSTAAERYGEATLRA